MRKLTVEDSFRNPAGHPCESRGLPNEVGLQSGMPPRHLFHNVLGRWYWGHVLPSNVSKPSEAAQMELIQLGDMPTIKRPGLASI